LAALTALVLPLTAACGGDDDDGDAAEPARSTSAESTGSADDADAQAYIDAAAASLTTDAELGLDQATATCISTAVVDLIGADALAESGVTPAQFAGSETFDVPTAALDDEAAARLSEALDGCDITGSLTSAFVDGLGVELPAEVGTCLDEHLDRRAVTEAFASSLLPATDAGDGSDSGSAGAAVDDAIETAYLDATVACPAVVTAAFLAEAPGTVTPEAQSCVSALVEANPDRVRAAFDGDSAAAEELGTEIASTCPEAVGG
jgi:hypothetical protein